MILLIIILLWPLVVVSTGLVLNSAGLLPGTRTYQLCQEIKRAELQTQLARTQAIASRYRAKENEMLDTIRDRPKQLEAAK